MGAPEAGDAAFARPMPSPGAGRRPGGGVLRDLGQFSRGAGFHKVTISECYIGPGGKSPPHPDPLPECGSGVFRNQFFNPALKILKGRMGLGFAALHFFASSALR